MDRPMKIPREEQNRRLSFFKKGLQKAGVKLTHQRLEIFRELVGSPNHPDAEAIWRGVRKRIPTLSLDTVYRTLWVLLDLGLISTLGPGRERTRFDANTRPHHHFVCSQCGMTRDFYSEDMDWLELPDSVKALGQMETTHVEVRGICTTCARKTRSMGKTTDR